MIFGLALILFGAVAHGGDGIPTCQISNQLYDARAPYPVAYRVWNGKADRSVLPMTSFTDIYEATVFAHEVARAGRCNPPKSATCVITSSKDLHVRQRHRMYPVYRAPGIRQSYPGSDEPILTSPAENLDFEDLERVALVLKSAGYCEDIELPENFFRNTERLAAELGALGIDLKETRNVDPSCRIYQEHRYVKVPVLLNSKANRRIPDGITVISGLETFHARNLFEAVVIAVGESLKGSCQPIEKEVCVVDGSPKEFVGHEYLTGHHNEFFDNPIHQTIECAIESRDCGAVSSERLNSALILLQEGGYVSNHPFEHTREFIH